MDDPGVKPLKFGDSDAMQAGDFVLAIGNPFGFEETVTDGIISSKGRPNRVDGFGDFLQTNAAINPGNSGGPLINLRGEVIGINTAIISRSGGSQGIGFAIPSNTVRMALESLLEERTHHSRLSRHRDDSAASPDKSMQAIDSGVVVAEVVPDSPAAEAQMQRGDVIQKFDGHDVRNIMELRRLVSQAELDKKVDLEVARNGKPVKVSAKIKERPPIMDSRARFRLMCRASSCRLRLTNPMPTSRINRLPKCVLGSIEVRELTPRTGAEAGRATRCPRGGGGAGGLGHWRGAVARG